MSGTNFYYCDELQIVPSIFLYFRWKRLNLYVPFCVLIIIYLCRYWNRLEYRFEYCLMDLIGSILKMNSAKSSIIYYLTFDRENALHIDQSK